MSDTLLYNVRTTQISRPERPPGSQSGGVEIEYREGAEPDNGAFEVEIVFSDAYRQLNQLTRETLLKADAGVDIILCTDEEDLFSQLDDDDD